MKLSTKARYGTRAMMDLALHYKNEPVQLKDVARRQRLSLSYLEHLITPLITAGLLKSTRGARGGIELVKPPQEIRLSEIVVAMEGPLMIVDCLKGTSDCPRSGACATQDIWGKLKMAMDGVLESVTLRDLAEQQKSKELQTTGMYQI